LSSLYGNQGYGGNAAGSFPSMQTGGGLRSGLGSRMPKPPKGSELVQNFTPDQMSQFESLFSHVGPDSWLSRMSRGDESQFDQLEAPAKRQFGEYQSDLASRFSGLGIGSRHGSGHQNAQTTAAQEFAEKLSSNRIGLQSNALRQLSEMSNSLLNQSPYSYQDKKKPFWQELLLGLSGGGGSALGMGGGAAFNKKLFG
jgi:hypothetical protein